MIKGVILTPQNIIPTDGGEVMHVIKSTDSEFFGFGEAYISSIEHGCIKGWKKHTKMISNITVPKGEVRFVLCEDKKNSPAFQEVLLSKDNYSRLTIPPNVWFAFEGKAAGTSMVLNISSITHDPEECVNKDLSLINYNWT